MRNEDTIVEILTGAAGKRMGEWTDVGSDKCRQAELMVDAGLVKIVYPWEPDPTIPGEGQMRVKLTDDGCAAAGCLGERREDGRPKSITFGAELWHARTIRAALKALGTEF